MPSFLSLFHSFFNIYFYVYGCLRVSLYTMCVQYPQMPERVSDHQELLQMLVSYHVGAGT